MATSTVGDVYEIVDAQVLSGQQVLNVYYYQVTSAVEFETATVAEALATQFIEEYIPSVLILQSADIVHERVTVRNLFNISDWYTGSLSLPGTGWAGAQSTLGTFNAVGYKLDGDNHAVRNGAKRISALVEDSVTDGVITDSGLTGALNDLGEAMAAPITDGLVTPLAAFIPVIVKRVAEVISGVTNYRLPASLAEAVLSIVVGGVWDAVVTSQTSRKIGRGS